MQFSFSNSRSSLIALTLCSSVASTVAHAQTPTATPSPLPQLSIKDSTVREGKAGLTSLKFKVELNKTPTKPVTVRYQTIGRTASKTNDFVNIQGMLKFDAGIKSTTLIVQVKGDTTAEEDETLRVKLTVPQGAGLRDAEAIGTIINDDGALKPIPGKGKIVYVSQDWMGPGLYIMNSDGSNRTRLTNQYYDETPVWSPDGKKVAFRTYTFDEDQFGYGLSVIDANGRNQKSVYIQNSGYGERPIWTSDSASLICTEANGSGNLVKVSVKDGSVTELTTSPVGVRPSVSQSGSKIAFYDFDFETFKYQVYTVTSSSGQRTRLTSDPESECTLPQITSDGNTIVFLKRDYNSIGLYAMNADGSKQRLILDLSTADFSPQVEAPILSSNGKKVLLPVAFEGQTTFYVADVRSGDVREIPIGSVDLASQPDFNPDGSRITFHATRDENYDVYIVNSDGKNQQRLTDSPYTDYQPDMTDGSVPTPNAAPSTSSSAATAKTSAPSVNRS
jgi:Tol biopolymer transport system component